MSEASGLIFFPGLDHEQDARHFDRCMISINRLRERKSDFPVQDWILDSGAFTELSKHGRFRSSVEEYAAHVSRWAACGNLLAAVSQDYMCEPFILAKTGLTVVQHQLATIERYDALKSLVGKACYVMPVLQGFEPKEYLEHLRNYGGRLKRGMWVGVGSVCKRNARVEEIERVLVGINRARRGLRLHGFGVKLTALASSLVRESLHSADSMAWSYHARKQGRNQHDWRECESFCEKIRTQEVRQRYLQLLLDF